MTEPVCKHTRLSAMLTVLEKKRLIHNWFRRDYVFTGETEVLCGQVGELRQNDVESIHPPQVPEPHAAHPTWAEAGVDRSPISSWLGL